MVTVGLLLRVEAVPGKEDEVEAILKGAVKHIEQEDSTPVWFALRLGPTSFGVFDAFASDTERQAHLEANGRALDPHIGTLIVAAPTIDPVDLIATKLP